MSKIICPQCGTENDGSGSFCQECGCLLPMTEQAPLPQTEELPKKAPGKAVRKGVAIPILLSVVLLIALVFSSAIFLIRKGFGGDALENVITKIDFTELEVGRLVDAADKHATIPQLIYQQISPEFKVFFGEEEEAVESIGDLMEEDFVKEFIAQKADDYVTAVFTGSKSGKIKPSEVRDFLEDNQKEIQDLAQIEYQLTDEDFDEVERYLKDNEDILDQFSLSEIEKENDDLEALLGLVRKLSSYVTMGVFLVLALLCIALLAFYVRNVQRTLAYAGSSFLLAGALVMLAAGVLTARGIAVLNDAYRLGEEVYATLLSPLKTDSLILGGILLAAGCVAIVLPLVMRAVSKGK